MEEGENFVFSTKQCTSLIWHSKQCGFLIYNTRDETWKIITFSVASSIWFTPQIENLPTEKENFCVDEIFYPLDIATYLPHDASEKMQYFSLFSETLPKLWILDTTTPLGIVTALSVSMAFSASSLGWAASGKTTLQQKNSRMLAMMIWVADEWTPGCQAVRCTWMSCSVLGVPGSVWPLMAPMHSLSVDTWNASVWWGVSFLFIGWRNRWKRQYHLCSH